MGRLRLLADEHVDRAYVRALRSNGFDVAAPNEDYPTGRTDEEHLHSCREADRVLLTNDRDFVRLAGDHDHAGVVIYTNQVRPASAFVRGIARIDAQFTADEMTNRVVWLAQWV